MLWSLFFGLFTLWCFGLGLFQTVRYGTRLIRGRVDIPWRIERTEPRRAVKAVHRTEDAA